MPTSKISVNRAPVLTLWSVVVAERMGYREAEALSLAKALTSLTAQSKGRRLGIIKPKEAKPGEPRKKKPTDELRIELMGRALPAKKTAEGIRAVSGVKVIGPEEVQSYLKRKFGTDLDRAKEALQRLAKSYPPKELARVAFHLYEQFRPNVPEGVQGWGAKGELNLKVIDGLAKG